MAQLQDIGSQLGMSGFNVNYTAILYVFIGAVVLGGILFFVMKWREKKSYDILVEITPSWSIKEKEHTVEIPAKEPTRFQKLLGIKPKPSYRVDVSQTYGTYFVRGAYIFNKKNGSYEIKFWDGIIKRTVIQPVDYSYFQPLQNHKWAKRKLKLVRTGALDYKPVRVRIDGVNEVENVVDNEATFTQFKTMEEIEAKFKKSNALMQYLPWIFCVIMVGVFGLIVYMTNKQYNETMTQGFQVLAESIKTNTEATKLLIANMK